MKIVVATSMAPFVAGGASQFADWLGAKLEESGHEVEMLRLPFSEHYTDVLPQLLALRLLDVTEHGDRLIALRTPCHLLRHPRKVVWFIHHYRSAYDLWGSEYQSIPNTPEGIACRQAIVSADSVGLGEASRLFCNSRVVQRRLSRFNGLDAEVLYPPLLCPEQLYSAGLGDFLLYFGRLTRHKRQWLAIESLRFTRSPVRLVIAGCPEPGVESYLHELRGLVARYDLDRRVSILPRWIPEHEKAELFGQCLAVAHFPLDEDSYGYTSLEAHAARKAILTTADSGGINELVVNGLDGLVTAPDPEQIAQAMDDLYNNRSATEAMGESGPKRVADLGISWDHVLDRLLS